MAKAWISVWVRLNKDVAEVMLVMLIQLPAEEEIFGVAGGMRLRYRGLYQAEDVTSQLPQFDICSKTIRIQRFAQIRTTGGLDMNVISHRAGGCNDHKISTLLER
jgi:hypothetical protein